VGRFHESLPELELLPHSEKYLAATEQGGSK
jgi:hypothetical protein